MLPLQDVSPSDQQLLDACGESPTATCELVLRWTDNETIARATDWLFARPLTILVIVVLALIVNRLIRRAIQRLAQRIARQAPQEVPSGVGRFQASVLQASQAAKERSAARAETVGSVLRSVSTVIVWTVAVLMILGELGISLGPLIAGAGIAGVALGFGAQSLVRDFLSGIFMLMEDQYGVGDVVDVGEAIGTVEALTLRTTRLRAVDGAVWHVPNGEIRRVGNMSQQWSRALLDVEVAYGTDIAHAQSVISRVAAEVCAEEEWASKILDPPEIWGVERFGPTGVAIRLVLKTKPGAQWGLQRELRHRLKDAFDAEGIDVPFPQQIMRIAGDDPRAHADQGPRPGPERREPPREGSAKGDPAEPPPG